MKQNTGASDIVKNMQLKKKPKVEAQKQNNGDDDDDDDYFGGCHSVQGGNVDDPDEDPDDDDNLDEDEDENIDFEEDEDEDGEIKALHETMLLDKQLAQLGRPSDIELTRLVRAVVLSDEVFDVVLNELSKPFGKRGASTHKKMHTGLDEFHQASELSVKHSIILQICNSLRGKGAKPSDKGFWTLLKKELSIQYKKSNLQDYLSEEEVEEYLDEVAVESDDITFEDGITNLKRYLAYRDYYRHVAAIVRKGLQEHNTEDPLTDVMALKDSLEQIQSIGMPVARTLEARLENHLALLETRRGKPLVGLKSGIEPIDRLTNGIRGLSLVCSPPNSGKTAIVLAIALGIIKHWSYNKCAVLLISLDMASDDLISRVICTFSGLTWDVVNLGDDNAAKDCLSPESTKRFKAGMALAAQYGQRLLLADRTDVGEVASARKIITLATQLRTKTNASQVLVIVDYIQLLDTGGHIGLDADRHQIRQLQQIGEAGYTVIAISEVRKPANSKDPHGKTVSDVKGDGRLGYAADAIFLVENMTNEEVARCYGLSTEKAKSNEHMTKFRQTLQDEGKTPLCLHLAKARDGMSRGREFFEFFFRTSTFVPLTKKLPVNLPGLDDEDDDDLPTAAAKPKKGA